MRADAAGRGVHEDGRRPTSPSSSRDEVMRRHALQHRRRPRRRSSIFGGSFTSTSAGMLRASEYEPRGPVPYATRSPTSESAHAFADRLHDAARLGAEHRRQRQRIESRAVIRSMKFRPTAA